MSVLGQRRIAAWVLLISTFGGALSPAAAERKVRPSALPPRFDVIGGVSSRQVIVKFRPETMERARTLRTMRHSVGRASLPAALSQRVHALYLQWRGRRIRPFYPFEFRHPELAARYGLDRTYLIEVPPGTDTPKMAAALRECAEDIETAGVTSIGGVSFMPDDPDFWKQYAMHNTGQTGGDWNADIDAPEAWDLHTGRLGTVTIAIIDTGVGPHGEFVGRMVPGINTNDFVNNPDLTIDGSGHGTHVAGIAAATGNNGAGVAGVTWGAYIMPVRVTDASGTGDPAAVSVDTAAGLVWAADHGADICNLSLQFYDMAPSDEAMLEASVNYAHSTGALVIAAAGNVGPHGHDVAAPARFGNCMAVSATDDWDWFTDFSNYGEEVEVSAPGDDIWSTKPNDNYEYRRGTSMSAPHVSGLAALIKSYDYSLSNDEIRTIMISTADPRGVPVPNEFWGYGRINAFAALSAVLNPSIGIVSSQAPNRSIDARQPFAVDGTNPDGWDSIDLTFDGDATGLTLTDFTVTTDPERVAPNIINVFAVGDTVALEFDAAIPVEAWTIITHNDSNTSTRIGFLPGDVDGDGTSTVQDIDRLLDAINGVGDPLPIWCTDINRSGTTTPQDILREIDLLNGAGEFPPFLNASLP